MIDQPKSSMPVVVFDDRDNWETIQTFATFLDDAGLDLLKGSLDGSVRAVAIETDYIDKDYRDTFSHFHSKKFTTPPSRCQRLHFFENPLDKRQLRNTEVAGRSYLGYSVIRPVAPNTIGRTLISPCVSIKAPSSYGCICEEKVVVQGMQLTAKGFPFIQQDVDATKCAEAALWMVCRYFSNKYPVHREVRPFELTRLTSPEAFPATAPSEGLYMWQLRLALRRLGFAPLVYSRESKFQEIFDELIYTYIESGFPLILDVGDHAIVAFGHQSDFGRAWPEIRDPVSTAHFCNGLVVCDDNRHPYQIIGSTSNQFGHRLDVSSIKRFMVPLPEKVYLPAEGFITVSENFLDHTRFGYAANSPSLRAADLVYRRFLTTGRSFQMLCPERGMGSEAVCEFYRSLSLPHFIWVCEITTREQFGARLVLGELIWDATVGVAEPQGALVARYPERVFFDRGVLANTASQWEQKDLTGNVPYPLYTKNLLPICP